MTKIIKWLSLFFIIGALIATAIVYGILTLSLPELSGKTQVSDISSNTSLERDALGHAVINAKSRKDAAFTLGYAHGQDRFFQMDLLRRNAAGELSELFGKAAVGLDKKMRFHQFRKRSKKILKSLPLEHTEILKRYAQGVNLAQSHIPYSSFEYLLTGASRKPWLPEDSLLVIFSMYLDLQSKTFNRDLTLTYIAEQFGSEMVGFLTQPSQYQAALDGSEFELVEYAIPSINKSLFTNVTHEIHEPKDIGSNNWAVTGRLTESGNALLADDMHLGLAVPIIWYRTQLNYVENDKNYQITGVSLPGAPAVVVGTNGHVAWGFTNAYIDTADWIALDETQETKTIHERIVTPDKEYMYSLEKSEFGPVKHIAGKKYALKWVAHQDYAVDMELMNLERATNVEEALSIAKTIGIPVQNMLVTDSLGNAAWQATGAIPARTTPTEIAIKPEVFDANWQYDAVDVPFMVNPDNNRLWSGNSRVVSIEQDKRFGNGGYALGARAKQIQQRLFEKEQFSEHDFYQIQLDNQAIFLKPWQALLLKVLNLSPEKYAQDIKLVENWGECACADSVGYTLVRRYRSALINKLFSPIETQLRAEGLTLAPIKNDLEPAAWQLISSFTDQWLPPSVASWPELLSTTYINMKSDLLNKHTGSDSGSLNQLTWGAVNELNIQHPFSEQIPLLSKLLDMPKTPAFGDSFMPAVQGTSFGASQRLFVQPGLEKKAILTLPGGQSGHPLSPYYRAGYNDYIEQKNTPLLPGEIVHRIDFEKR
ncbi:penicillin acylase family protein [Pseudoalteromonas sp. T1lg24]|uniref:penicillin acylase family protein n=1 Tax=Pseudoalteromonas sp. T1lg24 TaxID=2077099 RepID=UPI000CF73FEA|nr:penicillin acylase family protein [Pseudoalteromonas sp. T1lg24]